MNYSFIFYYLNGTFYEKTKNNDLNTIKNNVLLFQNNEEKLVSSNTNTLDTQSNNSLFINESKMDDDILFNIYLIDLNDKDNYKDIYINKSIHKKDVNPILEKEKISFLLKIKKFINNIYNKIKINFIIIKNKLYFFYLKKFNLFFIFYTFIYNLFIRVNFGILNININFNWNFFVFYGSFFCFIYALLNHKVHAVHLPNVSSSSFLEHNKNDLDSVSEKNNLNNNIINTNEKSNTNNNFLKKIVIGIFCFIGIGLCSIFIPDLVSTENLSRIDLSINHNSSNNDNTHSIVNKPKINWNKSENYLKALDITKKFRFHSQINKINAFWVYHDEQLKKMHGENNFNHKFATYLREKYPTVRLTTAFRLNEHEIKKQYYSNYGIDVNQYYDKTIFHSNLKMNIEFRNYNTIVTSQVGFFKRPIYIQALSKIWLYDLYATPWKEMDKKVEYYKNN